MTTLYLLDASGLIFRSFYAMPSMKRSDQTPTGAVFGFCSTLLRLRDLILTHSAPDETILWAGVFDVARRNFRHDIFPDYKSQRKQLPPDLVVQFPFIRAACQRFGCPLREVPNFEADDVIASYTAVARKRGYNVVIFSDDKDFMQLFDPHSDGSRATAPKNSCAKKPNAEATTVEIYRRGHWLTNDDLKAEFGIHAAHLVPDIQALAGDSTDGIPGVQGIGVKTAAELINKYGSLESLLTQVHTVTPPHRREKIQHQQERARISLQLATLRQDVAVNLDEEALAFPRTLSEAALQDMKDLCLEFEFASLAKLLVKRFEPEKG